MKARLFFASIAMASAVPAWALSPTTPINVQFLMAGATAQKNTLQNVLGGAKGESVYGFPYDPVTAICKPGTLDFFYDNPSGSNYRAYSCTLAAETVLPPVLQGKGLAGKNILIHYRLVGGSWFGVGPLSRAQPVTRMAVNATCTQPGTIPATPPATGTVVITAPVPTTFPLDNLYNIPSWICTSTEPHVPDVGVSDQEPAIFYKGNSPNDGSPRDATENPITAADLANIQGAVFPLQAVIMNIIATKKLITEMQIVQQTGVTASNEAVADANRPSLTSPQVTALLTVNGGVYNLDWTPVVGGVGLNKIVHTCRRISAVGTQIAANSFWLNYPCAATSTPPPIGPVFPPKLASPINGGVFFGGKYTVTEANLISNMRTCVQQYNDSGNAADNFAIGLLFTDNDPKSEKFSWDYLSIDGVAPSVPNAVSGAYRFVTTETWQYRVNTVGTTLPLTAPSNASQFDLVTGLFSLLGDPRVLAVQQGFLALPENGFIPGADGNNVWKATTSGPHACNPPTLGF